MTDKYEYLKITMDADTARQFNDIPANSKVDKLRLLLKHYYNEQKTISLLQEVKTNTDIIIRDQYVIAEAEANEFKQLRDNIGGK